MAALVFMTKVCITHQCHYENETLPSIKFKTVWSSAMTCKPFQFFLYRLHLYKPSGAQRTMGIHRPVGKAVPTSLSQLKQFTFAQSSIHQRPLFSPTAPRELMIFALRLLYSLTILKVRMSEKTNLDCSLTVCCNEHVGLLGERRVVNKATRCFSREGHEDKEERWGELTPSGRALQHTALTNSLVSSSFLSLSRTLFTVSNLNVSSVLESPL